SRGRRFRGAPCSRASASRSRTGTACCPRAMRSIGSSWRVMPWRTGRGRFSRPSERACEPVPSPRDPEGFRSAGPLDEAISRTYWLRTMAAKKREKNSDKPRNAKERTPSTKFNAEAYRQLSADETVKREPRFQEMGFPPAAPSHGAEEDALAPVPLPLPADREEVP